MEKIGGLEKNLQKNTSANQSVSSLLGEFENKVTPFLKGNFRDENLENALNKYSAALFIDYIAKKAYSESKSQHKLKSVNAYSNLFIINARKYIKNISDSINEENIKEILKNLEEGYIDKSQTKLSYSISHLRNNYTQGIISTIYSALYGDHSLESIGKAIKEGSRIGTSGDNQPKFREYWGIEKQLKRLIVT